MYSVVGCPDCGALKLVADRPETTQCPRCGRRTKFKKLHKFFQSEDADAAREVRARLLADRGGQRDAYEDLGTFAQLGTDAENAGVDDVEYLEASGIDPGEVQAAADRTEQSSGSVSRKDAVLNALRELDRPTEGEVADYAAEHGVEREYVERTLEKLSRKGDVTVTGGRYRLL